MRGAFSDQGRLFSYISPEARVPANHPLRKIRELVRDVLRELDRSLSKLYASEGRPSIPPEQLLSAFLLQVFYGIRSERQLMEQLDYNLLYRWFVGLSPDDLVWDPTVFTKNRDRLQSGEVFAGLTFAGCGSAVLAAGFPALGIGFLRVSLAFGLTVLTMAYAVGHVSGGHFNCAVTIGLWAGGRFKASDVIPYLIAQVAGAIVAAAVLYAIASGKPGWEPGGFASNG